MSWEKAKMMGLFFGLSDHTPIYLHDSMWTMDIFL